MAPKHFAPVWQHYERHEPTGRSKHHRAICKFCKYELSGQPERMKTHLQRCPNCPQHIKDDFATDNENSNGNNITASAAGFSVSASSKDYEDHAHYSDDVIHRHSGISTATSTGGNVVASAAAATGGPVPIDQTMTSLKRRRSVEVASGAEGLAGLPWAPTANASAIIPPQTAPTVPPAFQPPYPSAGAPLAVGTSSSIHNTGMGRHESMMGVYDNVRNYYSRLTPMNKMQTTIGPTLSPHPIIREAIARVPRAVRDRFYGCGMPLPTGIDGLRVLDLGCGSGRDCYVAAKLVGPSGEVIGVDMTDEQLKVAQEHIPEYSRTLGYQPHLKFIKGYIEFLSQEPALYPGSIDLCISNNAVNLSPNKELVLQSVFDILKEGGEFQFSDIYADRRLPNYVRSHPVLMGECLGGALYIEDFKRLCQRVGFIDARQVSPPAPVRIESPELRDLVGATQFYSITFRVFKFARPASVLEPTREDYGQVAIYRGTIEGQRARTRFDNEWSFEAQRPVLVDGNTAIMLGESWLRRHFEVRGDRSRHFGGFTSKPPEGQYEPWEIDYEDEEEINGRPGLGGVGVRRRGILPLPTPFFINGLRQQQQQQQQAMQQQQQPTSGSGSCGGYTGNEANVSPQLGISQRSSPGINDISRSPPQIISTSVSGPGIINQSNHRSTLRDPMSFPRLSSFSISQSNVRADGANGAKVRVINTASTQDNASSKRTSSPRFILPVNRVVAPSPYKASAQQQQHGPIAPRFDAGLNEKQTPPPPPPHNALRSITASTNSGPSSPHQNHHPAAIVATVDGSQRNSPAAIQ